MKLWAVLVTWCVVSAVQTQEAITQSAKKESDAVDRLVYVVSVSRHGVRSPTGKATQYERFSSAAWPEWPVAPGELTKHGYDVVRMRGGYEHQSLVEGGLIAPEGCADAQRVFFHGDSDQRTRETAKALAEGMFPGCRTRVFFKDEGQEDGIFHPTAAAISDDERARGVAGVSGRIGGSPESVTAAYKAQLKTLDDLLATCGTHVAGRTRMSLFDIPAALSAGGDDHVVDMKGPLNTGATLSENVLLEYAEGYKTEDVGWGCVDGGKLRSLIDIHTAAFDLIQRTPAVAGVQARGLVKTLAASLEQAATGKAVSGAEGTPGDKALYLVGHDTNLANLAGLLRAEWIADGRRNDTPPGSALKFELWKKPGDADYEVRAFFITQTLEQMREAKALSSSERPVRVAVYLPGCSGSTAACSLTEFIGMLNSIGLTH